MTACIMRGETHVYGRIIGDKKNVSSVCVFYWSGWKPLLYPLIQNSLHRLLKINWYEAGGGERGSVCFRCSTKMKITCLGYFEDDLKSCQWGFLSALPPLPLLPSTTLTIKTLFSLFEPLFESFICVTYMGMYIT